MTAATTPGPQNAWTALARIASPHRGTFALVALLALLAAVAELLAPVIYREAVNDIAGLFVGNPGSTGIDQMKSLLPPDDPAVDSAPAAAVPHARPRTAHTRGHVAPRTAEQALTTLLWAAGLLFALNVLSHYLSLSADQRTVVLASRIEADVIQGTFAHVLRQPLSFFARRSTGSLAKQIDQSDQISPIVTALAHQVIPGRRDALRGRGDHAGAELEARARGAGHAAAVHLAGPPLVEAPGDRPRRLLRHVGRRAATRIHETRSPP